MSGNFLDKFKIFDHINTNSLYNRVQINYTIEVQLRG